MIQDHNTDLKHEEHTERLKALQNKLGNLSGFLTTMRSDNNEEYKKISNDLEILMKQINTIRKNMEIYFVIILILMFIIIQKMLWTTGSSTNLSLLTTLF
ncbi:MULTISPECIES: hypothetical protein [spotted fever group]|jgi:hypothetical protein|uniref:Uncharacterized protein n=1 Tax=Rickettsia asembonensis TaxID=1068590 RepID=A0A0C2MPN7_9RICK|nr:MULTISPECIES: hypothetical protein [spotted fever group]MCC8462879.1 hypothetical protein [Rickettsia endosymbiont of Ecitomorpha arachnoides]HJD58661.1 hypothetical protein [Rickettsia endosymbiont of Ceroptres masudai]HJD59894.1 hypothetical protein [Rickettsia endosymbiont of Omalisus fontisbellaquei]KIJ89156.1 hypothetical protein SB78_01145 [Rickettsia asembonensis]WCR56993.1 MAG: hypothetical protein PG979_001050 [Rickettsia asembonensis]